MVNLQSGVRRLLLIALSWPYGTYHDSGILGPPQENSYLTNLRRKRWPFCKILSHASKSSFSARLTLFIICATCCSSQVKFSLNAI